MPPAGVPDSSELQQVQPGGHRSATRLAAGCRPRARRDRAVLPGVQPTDLRDEECNYVKNNKDGSCPKGAFHYPLIGISLADDSLQQSIADNRADSMSLSWGEPENDALALGYINKQLTAVGNVEFASLAAEGTAVFVLSGETARGSVSIRIPASRSASRVLRIRRPIRTSRRSAA